jgi:RNA exonuclease 1
MGKKRSHEEIGEEAVTATSALSSKVDTSTNPKNDSLTGLMSPSDSPVKIADDESWQQVSSQGKKKRRKNPVKGSVNYPSIYHSPNARLQSHIKISDLQNLILYILAEGTAPQWVAVRHCQAIRRVVTITIPGLEPGLFTGKTVLSEVSHTAEDSSTADGHPSNGVDNEDTKTAEEASNGGGQTQPEPQATKQVEMSPDDYYPKQLKSTSLPSPLRPLADVFPHVWPVKAPGDEKFAKLHSPLQAMLLTPIRTSKDDKKKKGPQLAKSEGFPSK